MPAVACKYIHYVAGPLPQDKVHRDLSAYACPYILAHNHYLMCEDCMQSGRSATGNNEVKLHAQFKKRHHELEVCLVTEHAAMCQCACIYVYTAVLY